MAPIVIGNHVLVGTSNDLDSAGWLESFDPETGQDAVEVVCDASESKATLDSIRGRTSMRRVTAADIPGCRAPTIRTPTFISLEPAIPLRRTRHRLAAKATTFSRVRSLPSTSTPARWRWYYQTSPHDTHDWDSAQTPVLVDGMVEGRAPQAGAHREPQWFLLHGRSRDRAASSSRRSSPQPRTGQRD